MRSRKLDRYRGYLAELEHQRDIALDREQAHYLTGVLRLAAGDPVSVFNARDGEWLAYLTEVTKKQPDQIDGPSRDGAFIHGLTLEGCRWDDKVGVLDDSKPKELFCPMPLILVRYCGRVKLPRLSQNPS